MNPLPADLLRRRVRNGGGGGPLITYYDLGTGERTELSGTSFLNWVDKTSNLLVDEYLVDPGAVVDLELARSAPGHWVTLVIELACWQVGATVRVGGPDTGPADLVVLGPDWQRFDTSAAGASLACSLHPLGLGFPATLPPPVGDFALEVRAQSDLHSPTPRSSGELAWVDRERQLTQQDLLSVDLVQPARTAGSRRLVRPFEPWPSVRDGLVGPLLTEGSAVILVGDDHERVERIRHTERVDA